MKIILEKEKCIGCGTCQAVCPEYWKMGSDNKAEYLGPEEILEQEMGCNKEAAEACPVQCIHVKK